MTKNDQSEQKLSEWSELPNMIIMTKGDQNDQMIIMTKYNQNYKIWSKWPKVIKISKNDQFDK